MNYQKLFNSWKYLTAFEGEIINLEYLSDLSIKYTFVYDY